MKKHILMKKVLTYCRYCS